jgi:hypothetical protein
MTTNNKYSVSVNGNTYDLAELEKMVFPEVIQKLQIDFQSSEGVNVLGLIILLNTLLTKVKNKSEYTLIIENLTNCILLIKKLEIDTGLGFDTY